MPGTWWGKTKALVPANVRSDKFPQAIGLIKDEDLRVMDNPPATPDKPFTARDLMASVPVSLPNGRYAFARGDITSTDPKYLTNAQGGRFELDWRQIEPKLHGRPGAADVFLGGQ